MNFFKLVLVLGIFSQLVGIPYSHASCDGEKRRTLPFCQALDTVLKEESCESLASNSQAYSTCRILESVAQHQTCVSPKLSRAQASACQRFLFGFQGGNCQNPHLPPLYPKKPPYDPLLAPLFEQQPNAVQTSQKLCQFGVYVRDNHQQFSRLRETNLILEQLVRLGGSLQPRPSIDQWKQILKLGIKIYPLLKEHIPENLTPSEAITYFSNLVRFVEAHREQMLSAARETKKPIFIHGGLHYRSLAAPSSIRALPNGRILVELDSILISGNSHAPQSERILNLGPIDKGAKKDVFLAFDYESGEPLAKIEVPTESNPAEALSQAKEERQLQNRLDDFNSRSNGVLFSQVNQVPISIRTDGPEMRTLYWLDSFFPYTLSSYSKTILENEKWKTIEGSPKETIKMDLIVSLLSQLNYLHSHGVHHRDIKPTNILVRLDSNGLPVARIADMGTAFDTRSEDKAYAQRKSKEYVGTPLFLSPEYMNELDEPGRFRANQSLSSDVWSMGLTVWSLIKGREIRLHGHPFQISHIETHADLASLFGVKFPVRMHPQNTLEYLLYRMLDPSPDRRIRTSEALALALKIQKQTSETWTTR